MNEEELVGLCPTDLSKYTWQNFREELVELQVSSELYLLKILQKYTWSKFTNEEELAEL